MATLTTKNKRQKMSESQSPDESVSFNYKELDVIGKGMYRNRIILSVVRMKNFIFKASSRVLTKCCRRICCCFLNFNDRIKIALFSVLMRGNNTGISILFICRTPSPSRHVNRVLQILLHTFGQFFQNHVHFLAFVFILKKNNTKEK